MTGAVPAPPRRAPADPSFVDSVRLVARREFTERLRDRSFLVSTGITLLVLVAAIVLPRLLGAGDPTTYRVAATGRDAPAVVPAARARADALGIRLDPRPAPPDPRADVDAGRLDAVVTDGGVVVGEDLDPGLGAVLQDAHRQVAAEAALRSAGLDPAAVARAQAVPPLPVQTLKPSDPRADTRERIAFVGVLLLYGQLFGYGFWVALGVVEEKSSRVIEVLLATVRPRALLTGKVLGIGLLGVIQLCLVAVVALVAGQLSGAVQVTSDAVVPVLLVLGWFVLGYAFYACFFAAAAARVSRQEDLQNVVSPATLLILVSFFGALYAAANPDRPVARVLSLLPPFSALVNPPRTAAGDVAPWEVLLAVALMVAATVGLVLVAARLYEGAVLRTGAKVGLREAWRPRSSTPAVATGPGSGRA